MLQACTRMLGNHSLCDRSMCFSMALGLRYAWVLERKMHPAYTAFCPGKGFLRSGVHTFGWKAAIGKAHNGLAAWLQHSVHLPEHLHGLGEVIHRDSIGDDVEGVVLIWELGVCRGAEGMSSGTENRW